MEEKLPVFLLLKIEIPFYRMLIWSALTVPIHLVYEPEMTLMNRKGGEG
jgi:hypothetical protein